MCVLRCIFLLKKNHPLSYNSSLLHLTSLSQNYVLVKNSRISNFFFFILEGNDDVEEQKAFIKKIHDQAMDCRFNSTDKVNESYKGNIEYT